MPSTGGRIGYANDLSAELLRGVVQGSFPYDAENRWVAVIKVYGDFSGTSTRKPWVEGSKLPKFYVAACYIGSESQWATADQKWANMLAKAKVPYFHATDFFACGEEFAAWKRGSKRHRDLEDEATSIAQDANLFGHAMVFETAAFDVEFVEVLNKIKPKYRLTSLRNICAQLCLSQIAEDLRSPKAKVPPDERVLVWWENEKGIGEVIESFCHDRKRRAKWTERILQIVPGDKKALRPLQIADLFANLCYRDLRGETRASYERMLVQNHMVRGTTAALLKKSLPELRRFAEEHPSGIAWPNRGRSRPTIPCDSSASASPESPPTSEPE